MERGHTTDWARTRESRGGRISPAMAGEFNWLGLSNASIFDVLSGLRKRHREQRHTGEGTDPACRRSADRGQALYRELLRIQPNAVEGLEGLGVLLFQLGGSTRPRPCSCEE